MIAITAIFTFIKNNKFVQYILLILSLILIVGGLAIHEVHSIKAKQTLADQLKDQKELTLAIQAQEVKDKAIIDAFNSTVGINTQKTEEQKQTVKQIIKDNSSWANTPLPDGLGDIGK